MARTFQGIEISDELEEILAKYDGQDNRTLFVCIEEDVDVDRIRCVTRFAYHALSYFTHNVDVIQLWHMDTCHGELRVWNTYASLSAGLSQEEPLRKTLLFVPMSN